MWRRICSIILVFAVANCSDSAKQAGNITNTDSVLSISASEIVVNEGNAGPTPISVTFSLNVPVTNDVLINYTVQHGPAQTFLDATDGDDITAETADVTISANNTAAEIILYVSGDTQLENNETFTLQINNVSGPTTLPPQNATLNFTVLNDDKIALNDSGVFECSNASSIAACDDATVLTSYPDQDAMHGHDSQGVSGFQLQKVNNNGAVISVDSTLWSCVLDQRTNLMWEVKTVAGFQAGDKRYAHNTTNTACTLPLSAACSADNYINEINNLPSALCGKRNWRLPTLEEFRSIIDYSLSPAINQTYFPNANTSFFPRLTSTRYYDANTVFYWLMSIAAGNDLGGGEGYLAPIRLVAD